MLGKSGKTAVRAQRLGAGHQLRQPLGSVVAEELERRQGRFVDIERQRRMGHQQAHDLQFQSHWRRPAAATGRLARQRHRLGQLEQRFDLVRRGLRQLRQAAHDLQAQRGRRHRLQQGLGVELHARPALGALQIMLTNHFLDQELRQRHRLVDLLLECFVAVGAHIGVRVVLGGQEQELDGLVVRHVRQARFQRAAGGAAAGLVAIEAEDHRIGLAHQFLHVVRGAGGAQGCYCLRETHLRQRHHVHIAFRHQHITRIADRLARLEQAVQLEALRK